MWGMEKGEEQRKCRDNEEEAVHYQAAMGGFGWFVGFTRKSQSFFCSSRTPLMVCLLSLAAERAAMPDANDRERVLKEQLLHCCINALPATRWVDLGRRWVNWLLSAAALCRLVLWLRYVMSRVQHALCLNCLLTGDFCTSSFATSFRTASVMFLSHDLQIWFYIEPWGIISAFGQVDGLYCISAKQTKVQLYHLTVEHFWFEKNSQNIPTFEKIKAAHLIIKRQWTH